MSARVRLEDLSPAVRARVVGALDGKQKRGRGSRGATRGGAWRCGGFTVYARAERHVDEVHHGARLECELEEPGA